jgi:hypothetical protein
MVEEFSHDKISNSDVVLKTAGSALRNNFCIFEIRVDSLTLKGNF